MATVVFQNIVKMKRQLKNISILMEKLIIGQEQSREEK